MYYDTRDGTDPRPLTDSDLAAIRAALRFYDGDHLTARLVATVDRLRGGLDVLKAEAGALRQGKIDSADCPSVESPPSDRGTASPGPMAPPSVSGSYVVELLDGPLGEYLIDINQLRRGVTLAYREGASRVWGRPVVAEKR